MKKILVMFVMLLVAAISCFALEITVINNSDYWVCFGGVDRKEHPSMIVGPHSSAQLVTVDNQLRYNIVICTHGLYDIRGDEPSSHSFFDGNFIDYTYSYDTLVINRNNKWHWE